MASGQARNQHDIASSVSGEEGVYVDMSSLITLETPGRLMSVRCPWNRNSLLAGGHTSLFRDRGLDFEELRHYQPGDDLRYIDRRATARTGQPFVRSFLEERDRPTIVVCDQRMNMFFGSCLNFKSYTAAELGALLGWSAFHSGDRVGVMVFNDQRIDTVAPHRSRQRLQQCLATIHRQNRELHAERGVSGAVDFDQLLARCLNSAPHDHTIYLVSDFMGISDKGEETTTLRRIRRLARHNDVLAFQVYDPIALNLPTYGRVTLMEGEQQISLDLGRRRMREPISEYLKQRLEGVQAVMRRNRIPVLPVSAGEATVDQYLRGFGGKL